MFRCKWEDLPARSSLTGEGRARGLVFLARNQPWKPWVLAILLLLTSIFVGGTDVLAQGYQAQAIRAMPPEELHPAVGEVMSEETVRVVGPAGVLCEIWIRKGIPERAQEQKELGVSFSQIVEGTLVGAVRFPAGVVDFRRGRVRTGVYTLRYALNPVDGNHQGVAPQRDFLLLAQAQADTNPANITRDELVTLSRKALGSTHPSVWSLGAELGPIAKLPVVQHREEEDHWVVLFPAHLQAGNGAGRSVVFALVVVGYAPES